MLLCAGDYRDLIRAACDLTHKEIWYRRVDAEELEADATGVTKRFFKRMFRKARLRTSKREVGRLAVMVDDQPHIREDPPLIFPVKDSRVRSNMCSLLGDYTKSLSPDRRVLLDRYHVIDVAYRVVGVGSVGTRCLVALLLGDGEDDPLFLQLKEANRSVLEPFVRRCSYPNQGERVVQGQRIIQAASDLFLGWKTFDDHDFYVRQLKDMKGTIDIDDMDPQTIVDYAELCGMTLAHAHARGGDFAQIAGYLGKGDRFDTAIADFAEAYADQVEIDHALLQKAVRTGRLDVELSRPSASSRARLFRKASASRAIKATERISIPASVTSAVSSDFTEVIDGFHATACAAPSTYDSPGTANRSRPA